MKSIKFVQKLRGLQYLQVLLYPVTLLVTTPMKFFQQIWLICLLFKKPIGSFSGFTIQSGLNNFFYWRSAYFLFRYGRGGVGIHVGLGRYDLGRWIFYTVPSLFIFWKIGAFAPVIGMLGWSLSHLIWLKAIDIYFVVVVMSLATWSTLWYVNTFKLQNYNALGWMLFPMGLYSLIMGNCWVTAAIWICISYMSVTVVFIAVLLSFWISFLRADIFFIIATIPAIVKLCFHFKHSFRTGNYKDSIKSIFKAIGVYEKTNKYKRTKTKQLRLREVYFVLLYLQFVLATIYFKGSGVSLCIVGVLIFVINTCCFRFADEQSMQMMLLSLITAIVLYNQNYFLLPFFWLAVSPIPYLLRFQTKKLTLDRVPVCKPFLVTDYVKRMETFLNSVLPNQRVLFAFNDPKGIYENIFDGYRVILELPLYVSTLRGFHLMPDWWCVFETNYAGAPNIWGRDPEDVIQNMQYWKADYAIIYQIEDVLDNIWIKSKFEVIDRFDWKIYSSHFAEEQIINGALPVWWLLRRKT